MKAPEKIFIDQHPFKDEYEEYWYSSPAGDKSVEYIRKDIVNSMLEMVIHPTKSEVRRDVFIDKACDWIKENITNNPNANSVLVRNGCVTLGMLVDDFRNHMLKGE